MRAGWWHLALVAVAVAACGGDGKRQAAYARRIQSPHELIGGPKALGTIGDWAMGNHHIRVVIQDKGWSRGFGIFGGGIIDADLQRPDAEGNALGGNGKDAFGEYFPALFLQAFDVADQPTAAGTLPAIEVLADGKDGGPAIIRTRAAGGDFLTMFRDIIDVGLPQRNMRYETDYIVRPGARHVEIVGRLVNLDANSTADLTGQGLRGLLQQLGNVSIDIPIGDVMVFAGGQSVFLPGGVRRTGKDPKRAGFDLRFSLEQAYKNYAELSPAVPSAERAWLPGLVVDFLATAGDGVSYGIAAGEDPEHNYVWKHRATYGLDETAKVSPHAMLVPFLIASVGMYYVDPPAELARAGQPGDTFEYRRYLIIGNGDVASVRDELFEIRGQKRTGRFEGNVQEKLLGAPGIATLHGEVRDARGELAEGAWVHVYDADRLPYTQARVDAAGRFRADVEAGSYFWRVTAPGRWPFPSLEALDEARFTVGTGEDRWFNIVIDAPGELVVSVIDPSGRPLPAKVSAVDTYDPSFDGQDPMDFLFDLSLGEERRSTDLTYLDAPAERRRQFVEEVFYTPGGEGRAPLRPGTYDIYVSRGLEYDLVVERGVKIEAGKVRQVHAVLTRVVDTSDYVSADLHVHTIHSIDSGTPIAAQVTSAAAEGVELLVSSEHNFLSDFRPAIHELGLQDFVQSVVGVELSTLEMGHFNGFPLTPDPDVPSRFPLVEACFKSNGEKVNGTAFDWVQCSPQQLFDNLRALGAYGEDDTIVQVNHPRDNILGYFNEYYLNPYTALAEAPSDDNYPGSGILYPHNADTEQWAPEKLSLDFDALEVLTGKRQDLLHAFVIPESASDQVVADARDYVCSTGHPDNDRGRVLLRKGGYIHYPGAVDDWLHLLNRGERITATGNSDSHGAEEEMGAPRNFFYVPRDSDEPEERRDVHVGELSPLDLVHAIKSRRGTVTNGPFLDVRVRTATADTGVPPCSSFDSAKRCREESCLWNPSAEICTPPVRYWHVGDTVRYGASNAGRSVDFEIVVRRAPWVSVDRVVVYANGEVLDVIALPAQTEIVLPRSYVFDVDTVVVLEAHGDASLFPVVTPKEDPPTNIADALSSVVGSIGTTSKSKNDGVSGPAYVQKVRPYALTNPIWLDIDASGEFDAPGNLLGPQPAPSATCPEVRAAEPTVDLFASPRGRGKGERTDIRRIFGVGHSH